MQQLLILENAAAQAELEEYAMSSPQGDLHADNIA